MSWFHKNSKKRRRRRKQYSRLTFRMKKEINENCTKKLRKTILTKVAPKNRRTVLKWYVEKKCSISYYWFIGCIRIHWNTLIERYRSQMITSILRWSCFGFEKIKILERKIKKRYEHNLRWQLLMGVMGKKQQQPRQLVFVCLTCCVVFLMRHICASLLLVF